MARVAAALERAGPSLRAAVARRARLQFAPALRFHYDPRPSAEGFSPEFLAEMGPEEEDFSGLPPARRGG